MVKIDNDNEVLIDDCLNLDKSSERVSGKGQGGSAMQRSRSEKKIGSSEHSEVQVGRSLRFGAGDLGVGAGEGLLELTKELVKGRRGLGREEFRKFKGKILGEFGRVYRSRDLDIDSIDIKFNAGEKFQYYNFPIYGKCDVSFCGFTVDGK
jgi:hypothetical protein